MSHSFPTEYPIAKKIHFCTWCGEKIEVGKAYKRWNSVEDSWFTNKMHLECASACRQSIIEQYTPYENERGERFDE